MRVFSCIAVALVIGSASFRVRPKRKSSTAPGQVHGVFPMGSPGTAKPPLVNARGGPCFPGFRSWTMKRQWWGVEADLATTVTGVLGYRHPLLAAHELDMKKNELREIPCNADTETPNLPRGTAVILHDWEMYVNASQGHSDLLYDIGNVGIRSSFELDRTAAAETAALFGWQLIGSAVDNGNSVYVGKQVSHLMQQPQTKACILTFQGSSSTQDWVANANARSSEFCGLSGDGGSMVHKGFRDKLREMVQNSDWQSDVRAKLPTCSKVYVTGHSSGGAQAELFAACAQKAPQPGQDGYEEDYKYIEWRV